MSSPPTFCRVWAKAVALFLLRSGWYRGDAVAMGVNTSIIVIIPKEEY